VVAERADPRDAQLRDRDALSVRYGRQTLHELEVMSDVLEATGYVSRASKLGARKMTLTSSCQRPNSRLTSPSSKS